MPRCRHCDAQLVANNNRYPSNAKRNNRICIQCAKAHANKHYHANKQEIAFRRRQRYHKEANAARCHQYYLDHRAQKLAHQHQYDIEHKVEKAANARQYRSCHKAEIAAKDHQYYCANKDKISTRVSQWQRNNPTKTHQYQARYRARKANTSIGDVDIPAIYERDQVCVYCGSDQDLTIDHVVPISHGGAHRQDNLVVACRPCNSSKHNKPLKQWLKLRR